MGLLLLVIGAYQDSEAHLLRASKLFHSFSDSIRGAQVNETLARLYIETGRYTLAQEVIRAAVKTLELTDSEALLAEALATKGVVATRLTHYSEAKNNFEAAHRIAQRCGDREGAGRALLMMFEEIGDRLEKTEEIEFLEELNELLPSTQQGALQASIKRLLESKFR
jgi:tetratricopeptide (TPR) repeat protein